MLGGGVCREKACVFLSLILHEISELGLKNLKNGLGDNLVHSLGSVSMKFNAGIYYSSLKNGLGGICCTLQFLSIFHYYFGFA